MQKVAEGLSKGTLIRGTGKPIDQYTRAKMTNLTDKVVDWAHLDCSAKV